MLYDLLAWIPLARPTPKAEVVGQADPRPSAALRVFAPAYWQPTAL